MYKCNKLFKYIFVFSLIFLLVGCDGSIGKGSYFDIYAPIGIIWKWFWSEYTPTYWELLLGIWQSLPGWAVWLMGVITYILGFVLYICMVLLFLVIIVAYSAVCIALGIILLVVWFIVRTVTLWLSN